MSNVSGNLTVSTSPTALQLAQRLVPSFVTVQNADFTGNAAARGSFSGGNSCGLPIDSGVILSSGPISNAVGPNNRPGDYYDPDFPTPPYDIGGDSQLEGLVGNGETLDAAVLEFDVTSPNAFELKFRFVYASEEYPNFIGAYNDPMGIFVGGVNIAFVPGTTQPVSVSTINGGCVAGPAIPASHPEFYSDNYDSDHSSSERAVPAPIFNVQYDGMTILLEARVQIPANASRHVKIAIADYDPGTADRILDSAVFLGNWQPDECQ